MPPIQTDKSRQLFFQPRLSVQSEQRLKRLKDYLPLVFSLFAIASWSALTASINTGQFGDNIEQFNWAHGPEWGYWKHPPLPTLLLAGVIAAFGNSIYWAYCLSALCFMGTAFFTWKIASKLLGEHAAAVTVILLGLHFNFSWRAQIYNHNTVLLLMIAVTVWTSLLAAESKSRWHWITTGCFAGLALLSKYQAIVPLLGLLFALQRSGSLKEGENRRGLGLAALAACLVFLPHFVWLCINHFPTVQYAKHSAQNLSASARGRKLFGFLFFQIRTYLLILIDLGLVLGYFRFSNRIPKVWVRAHDDTHVSAWMWGLIGLPALVLILMVVLGGVKLESHWGLQTFQFAGIWLVWRFKASISQISIHYFLIPALLIHIIAMGLYHHSNATIDPALNSLKPFASSQSKGQSFEDFDKLSSNGVGASWGRINKRSHKRFERIFPAQALADQAKQDWQKATHCPLKYVVGPAFEAGVISLYSGSFPAVLENGDPLKSPWVDLSDLAASGAIEVWTSNDSAPVAGAADGSMNIGDAQQTVYWQIHLPQRPCKVSGENYRKVSRS